jgi:hypothetical protein
MIFAKAGAIILFVLHTTEQARYDCGHLIVNR